MKSKDRCDEIIRLIDAVLAEVWTETSAGRPTGSHSGPSMTEAPATLLRPLAHAGPQL